MATLPEIRQTAFISGTLINTSDVANINDENDATFIESQTGNNVDGQWRYSLNDTPSDFESMDDFTIGLRAMLSATGDDTWEIRAFIADSSGNAISGIPAYQAVSLASATAFSFTPSMPSSNTKAVWDDAHIIIDYRNVKNMASDGNAVQVARSGITGNYTQAITSATADIAETAPLTTESMDVTSDVPLPPIARPIATLAQDAEWTAVGAATIHEATDEEVPNDDIDYANAEFPQPSAFTVQLSALEDPQVSNDHIIRIRMRTFDGGGGLSFDVNTRLLNDVTGTPTVITDRFEDAFTSDPYVTFEYTLTDTEADAITEYDDLGIEIEAIDNAFSVNRLRVTWIEFEVPTASTGSSADIAEVSPAPQESLGAEVGATELTVADSIPITMESNGFSVEAFSDIQDTTPAPTESSSLNVDVSANLVDSMPVPAESLDTSIGPVTAALDDNAPAPTESISAEVGPVTSDIVDTVPVPDALADLAATVEANISDESPKVMESLAAEIGPTTADISDALSLPNESIDIQAEVVVSTSDVTPIATEALDGQIQDNAAEVDIADVIAAPSESIDVSVETTTILGDTLPTPTESIDVEVGETSASINDTSPNPSESVEANLANELDIGEFSPTPTELTNVQSSVDVELQDSSPIPNELNDIAAIAEFSISDSSPLPSEDIVAQVGNDNATNIAEESPVPQELMDLTVPSVIDIGDAVTPPVESFSSDVLINVDMQDNSPIPVEARNTTITTALGISGISPIPEENAVIQSGNVNSATIEEESPVPQESMDVLSPQSTFIAETVPVAQEEMSADAHVSSHVDDTVLIPIDATDLDVDIIGSLSETSPSVRESMAVEADGSSINASIDEQTPLPNSLQNLSISINVSIEGSLPLPIESLSAAIPALIEYLEAGPVPFSSISITVGEPPKPPKDTLAIAKRKKHMIAARRRRNASFSIRPKPSN